MFGVIHHWSKNLAQTLTSKSALTPKKEFMMFNRFFCLNLLLAFVVFSCQTESPKSADTMNHESSAESLPFDWQGHRGARGLLPENSIPAFLKALDFPAITTLEMDVAISKDSQIVISHEPWMSSGICSHPDGKPVTKEEEAQILLYQMTYDEIKKFDCGSRGNERFTDQQPTATYKPLLSEMVEAVENKVQQQQLPAPLYNIEIKSDASWDGEKAPSPKDFVYLLLKEIKRLGISERVCIQSFDIRSLQIMHQFAPEMTTALLIENKDGVEDNLKKLGYVPNIYSPYYQLITANTVKVVHEKGMRLIPWTVNETSTMESLIKLGVDGIITDYPNLIPEAK